MKITAGKWLLVTGCWLVISSFANVANSNAGHKVTVLKGPQGETFSSPICKEIYRQIIDKRNESFLHANPSDKENFQFFKLNNENLSFPKWEKIDEAKFQQLFPLEYKNFLYLKKGNSSSLSNYRKTSIDAANNGIPISIYAVDDDDLGVTYIYTDSKANWARHFYDETSAYLPLSYKGKTFFFQHYLIDNRNIINVRYPSVTKLGRFITSQTCSFEII